MTDDKNKNPEDGAEEEFAEFEDDLGEEGLDEDFHEEGEEFVEEDWEAYDDEGDFPMADEGGKKSSKLVVVVGGLVLLGGVGFAAMQIMGGGTAPQTQGTMPAADGVADALPAPDAMSGGNNTAMTDGAGATASQNEMSPPSATQDFTPPPSDPELDFEMPMPFSNNNEPEDSSMESAGATDTVPTSTDIDQQPLTPLPQESGTDDEMPGLTASGDSAENMQNDADVAKSDSGSNIPAWSGPDSSAPPSEAGGVESPQSSAIDNSAMKSLESKLDKLFNRLDTIENELAQVKKSDSGSDINELQTKIRQLEREISNMDERASSAGAASSANTASKKTSSRPAQASSAAYDKPEISARDWILTSAQPGKATLRKAGGNDVISVEAGDSVSGLGRIVSIGLEDGKWVVKATSGRISQ